MKNGNESGRTYQIEKPDKRGGYETAPTDVQRGIVDRAERGGIYRSDMEYSCLAQQQEEYLFKRIHAELELEADLQDIA